MGVVIVDFAGDIKLEVYESIEELSGIYYSPLTRSCGGMDAKKKYANLRNGSYVFKASRMDTEVQNCPRTILTHLVHVWG